jgi:hypothetical protein
MSETSKWLPRTRYITDAVPAAVLSLILAHELRLMPAAMRQHLADLQREADAWHRRQAHGAPRDASHEMPRPATATAQDERNAPAATNGTPSKITSAVSPELSTPKRRFPQRNPHAKRRLSRSKLLVTRQQRGAATAAKRGLAVTRPASRPCATQRREWLRTTHGS